MTDSNYRRISSLGGNIQQNDPLTYCLLRTIDAPFLNGAQATTISGKYGKNCQAYMSDYCAKNWNEVCEFASQDKEVQYPNTLATCGSPSVISCSGPIEGNGANAGDILVANTAAKKYLVGGRGCGLKYEPFDPLVANSPMISYFTGSCNSQGNESYVPIYAVNPSTIDSDPVMNKILAKPNIAWGILVNIFNTSQRLNKFQELKGTKIYNFFMSEPFQNYLKIKKMMDNRGRRM